MLSWGEAMAAIGGRKSRTRKCCGFLDQFETRTNAGVEHELFERLERDDLGSRDCFLSQRSRQSNQWRFRG